MAKKSSKKKSSRKSAKPARKVTAGHVQRHAHPKSHMPHNAAHELGALIIRFALGIVFVTHGAMKLFVTGGSNVGQFMASLGVPAAGFFAWFISILEFVGGICLLLGLLTRWAALLLAIDMFFAWLLVHAPNGFFIGSAIGYEFVLTLMLVCLGVFFHGAGLFSLERALLGREL